MNFIPSDLPVFCVTVRFLFPRHHLREIVSGVPGWTSCLPDFPFAALLWYNLLNICEVIFSFLPAWFIPKIHENGAPALGLPSAHGFSGPSPRAWPSEEAQLRFLGQVHSHGCGVFLLTVSVGFLCFGCQLNSGDLLAWPAAYSAQQGECELKTRGSYRDFGMQSLLRHIPFQADAHTPGWS